MTRTLRCDKFTFAVLEATLKLYLKEETVLKNHPLFKILLKPIKKIKTRANSFARLLAKEFKPEVSVAVKPGLSEVGGGSLSTEQLPSFILWIKPKNIQIEDFARNLRRYKVPIFGRIAEGSFLLDFRTIQDGEERIIIEAIREILKNPK